MKMEVIKNKYIVKDICLMLGQQGLQHMWCLSRKYRQTAVQCEKQFSKILRIMPMMCDLAVILKFYPNYPQYIKSVNINLNDHQSLITLAQLADEVNCGLLILTINSHIDLSMDIVGIIKQFIKFEWLQLKVECEPDASVFKFIDILFASVGKFNFKSRGSDQIAKYLTSKYKQQKPFNHIIVALNLGCLQKLADRVCEDDSYRDSPDTKYWRVDQYCVQTFHKYTKGQTIIAEKLSYKTTNATDLSMCNILVNHIHMPTYWPLRDDFSQYYSVIKNRLTLGALTSNIVNVEMFSIEVKTLHNVNVNAPQFTSNIRTNALVLLNKRYSEEAEVIIKLLINCLNPKILVTGHQYEHIPLEGTSVRQFLLISRYGLNGKRPGYQPTNGTIDIFRM